MVWDGRFSGSATHMSPDNGVSDNFPKGSKNAYVHELQAIFPIDIWLPIREGTRD